MHMLNTRKPKKKHPTLGEMEVGQSSGSSKPSSEEEVWAKLVPLDSRFPEVEIRSNETVVCSDITSGSGKRVWCQLIRNSDLCSAKIKNKSSSVILVDGAMVENNNVVSIKCGSEIVPGSVGKGHLKYKFEVMPVQDVSSESIVKISMDAEHAKCSICLNVWHDVVTVAPCLHNFCNGCFSEWLKRSQEKRTGTLCPQCRGVTQFVGRNHFLHNIEEDILKADPSLRRPKDELDVLDSYARIKSNMVLTNGKVNSRKRTRSPIYSESEDSYNDSEDSEHPCPQCGAMIAAFRCNQNTVHLQCHSCGGMMPSRPGTIPQHCLGCDRAFCGAYWHAQRLSETPFSDQGCSRDTFIPISERRLTRIPPNVHEMNQYEQGITERCIQLMGKTLQDVLAEEGAKLDTGLIDRTRLPLNHADSITTRTHLCNECYDKFVSYLLYWFRVTLPSHFMPPDALSRVNCWYGYACRTQQHSVDHARKLNHVCRPTRGSHM